MPAEAPHSFIFVCGPDDFLVNRIGKERFETLVQEEGADEFSREIISAFASNIDEVEAAVNRFRDAVLTMPMFGGKRIVWLKDVNFLADSVTGRAEGTLRQVEALQALLEKVNADQVGVIITAAPVDRRRAFARWCEASADFILAGGNREGGDETLAALAMGEARGQGVEFGAGALELLLQKTGSNTRLLTEEVRKLAAYAGEGSVIEEAHVGELTPNFAEGDFFEAADRFFAGDLPGTLAALQRHFFAGGEARPILAALQNRNRLLIQCRVLIDTGELRLGPRGFDKGAFERAAGAYAKHFGGGTEKNSFNLFTQNLWYLGKLAGAAKLPSLRRLIDQQQDFIRAFEELIHRPAAAEEVLRELAVRCLT
ncbi:MAG: DNA polymerase III subunit delta [Opitutaceae bacterium]|nr:DNA polymerase III subunit delta [Opitutaceae bacterium]